ncbi:alpha/beta hydrolase [Patescibacteria group bacterium]|nr:alpha/beta hydrolase [Patescibacteria group bacterium]
MKWLRFFLILIAVVLLIKTALLLVAVYQLHQQLARSPIRSQNTPATYRLSYQLKTITSLDGTLLASWYIPSHPSQATVLLVPGLHRSKTDLLEVARQLNSAHYTTLLLDPRGEGASRGSHSYLGTKEWQDVVAAYATAKNLPESRGHPVGMIGFSTGADAVLLAAGRKGIGDFILTAVPFADFNHLANYTLQIQHLPTWLSPWLLLAGQIEIGQGYQDQVPDKYIQDIHVPLLLIGANKDQSVPPTDATYLFSLANPPKQLWQSPTGHHVYEDNPTAFGQHMLGFIQGVARERK